MQGCITTRHLILRAPTIILEFGLVAYGRCVLSVLFRKKATFLECVATISRSARD